MYEWSDGRYGMPYDEPRTELGADFAESAIFSPGLVFLCYRRESLQICLW